MNRKTLSAIAAFAVLGIIALYALRQPEKGETAKDQQRPIAKVNPAELDTLQVTRSGATTTLKKEGDKFKVSAPLAYPADEFVAKAAFEAIGKLDFSNLVTEKKTKHAEFEVEEGKGLHVVAKSEKTGGKVLADLYVGKAAGNGTMVRPAGKDDVWQAAGGLRATFDKAPTDWRDKSITTFNAADVEMLKVKAKDGNEIITKKTGAKVAGSADDKWDVATSSVKFDKLDNTIPNGIVSSLASWKTNDFADGAKAADTGLDAPALTITVTLKGGKKVTVLVGNKKGQGNDDDFYVKADAPQVFLVKKFGIERVNKRPIEFKDKTVCDLPEADIAEIAVTNAANSFTVAKAATGWKATKPPKLDLDTDKMGPMASGFKDWKAVSIAEDGSPAATGLGKPRAVIVAKSKSKPGDTCSLKVGDETKDKQNTFVQSAKGPDVYLVPKWSIDRILLKVDDLKKVVKK
jgi:Domain of unknown function (DUF4340)